MEEYKNYLIAKGYSVITTKEIIRAAEQFLKWINTSNLQIEVINYNDITAYIKHTQQRGVKANTLQQMVVNVKHYLNYLVEASIVSHNPALALKLKNSKVKTVYNIMSFEELETIYKTYRIELPVNEKALPQILNILARKRNKILLGLLIYQGIATDDIKNLEIKHLELREGKITIPGTRRSNERTLKLEPHQIFDLFDYINEVRKQMLTLTKKQTDKLFFSTGTGTQLQNTVQNIANEIREQHQYVENLHQIRASVITNWLKQYNKRKVQYMAGHRYVSSTEHYEASNIDALQEDVEKYYPSF